MTQQAKNTVQTSPATRRRHRAGSAFWMLVALVPLLAWLAAVILIAVGRSTEPATGNPLLDRYLAAVADNPSQIAFDSRIPDRWFAQWETEFGTDPQYWLLRSLLARDLGPGVVSELADLGVEPRCYYLEEARHRGIVDGAVLIKLLDIYHTAWLNEARFLVLERHPRPGNSQATSSADWLRYWSQLQDKVQEQHGVDLDCLLAEIQAQAGDCSITWYLAAMLATLAGDTDRALECLSKGNRAPVNSNLEADYYYQLLDYGNSGGWFADPVISGAVFFGRERSYVQNYMLGESFRVLAFDAAERGDMAALDELHTMACRYLEARCDTALNLYSCSRMVQRVQDAFMYYHAADLSQAEQLALADLENRLNTVRGIIWSTGRSFGGMGAVKLPHWLDTYYVYGGVQLRLENLAAAGPNAGNLIQSQKTLKQMFIDMERFSYSTVSWE